MVKNLPANAGDEGDLGSIPGQEGTVGQETHYSILAWWAIIHEVTVEHHLVTEHGQVTIKL